MDRDSRKRIQVVEVKHNKELCLALPDFHKLLEVKCDASRMAIGAILIQDERPIAYFSEKLNDAKRKYSSYNKEFYAII